MFREPFGGRSRIRTCDFQLGKVNAYQPVEANKGVNRWMGAIVGPNDAFCYQFATNLTATQNGGFNQVGQRVEPWGISPKHF
jgi:hypothetical protein